MRLKSLVLFCPIFLATSYGQVMAEETPAPVRKNIVIIDAHDLGWGQVGFNGQKTINTPYLDQYAESGIVFKNFYASAPYVSASVNSLLTGRDAGNTVWEDYDAEFGREESLAQIFRKQGYDTSAYGAWGMASVGTDSNDTMVPLTTSFQSVSNYDSFKSAGTPTGAGFDHFVGFMTDTDAQVYYHDSPESESDSTPEHPYQGGRRQDLYQIDNGLITTYATNSNDYLPDLILNQALSHLDDVAKSDKSFFMYLPSQLPQAELVNPPETETMYASASGISVFPETPWTGDIKTPDYPRDVMEPRATLARMITHLDSQIKLVVDELKTLGIYDQTVIIVTSTNGHHIAGGINNDDYFDSNGDFRGQKWELHEGGINVPTLIFGGGIQPQVVTQRFAQFQLKATLAEMLTDNAETSSFYPLLKGEEVTSLPNLYFQNLHEQSMYQVYPTVQAVIQGDYKLVRYGKNNPTYHLYDLSADPAESKDVWESHCEIGKTLLDILNAKATAHNDAIPESDTQANRHQLPLGERGCQDEKTPTLTVEWQPDTISQGESATLNVESNNVAYCRMDGGVRKYGAWSDTVYENADRTATVRCYSAYDTEVIAQKAALTVNQPDPELDVRWEPSVVLKGDSATLYVNANYVSYCLNENGVKTTATKWESGPFHEEADRSVEIHCFDNQDQDVINKTAVLTVSQPTLAVSWSPASVNKGEKSSLHVNATNVAYCLDDNGKKSELLSWETPASAQMQSKTASIQCFNHDDQKIIVKQASLQVTQPTLSARWSPSTINIGEMASLSVTATNVDHCKDLSGKQVGTSWTQSFTHETNSRTDTVQCFSSDDKVVIQKAIQLTVRQPELSVSWVPVVVDRGEVSTVHVNAVNVAYCTGDGGVRKGTSWVTKDVYENKDRTITIHCYDKNDQVVISKQATLTVNQPTLDVYWEPSTIYKGEGSTVHVTATHVDHCLGDGGVNKGTSWTTGPVYEPENRTITIRCYDSRDNEVKSAQATLTVKPKPTLSVSWQPAVVNREEVSYVHVNATNVAYCLGDDDRNNGTSWVSAPNYESSNRTVTISCYDGESDQPVITQKATLTVKQPTLNVSWQPSAITLGQASSVHVNATNVAYCKGDGGVKKGTSWVTPGYPTETRSVTIRCYNSLDKEVVSQQAKVTVLMPKPTLSVYWQPSTINRGETSSVHVNAANVSYCRGDGDVKKGTSWVATDAPSATRNVTIRCYDSQDKEVISKQARVTVRQPSLSVYWQPSTIKLGEASTVYVSASNVSYCRGDSGVKKGTSWVTLGYPDATRRITIKCYGANDQQVISQSATVNVIR